MKTILLSFVLATFSFSAIAADGLALTWKNKYGKWFACGPVQCTWTANETESEALEYVINDNRQSLYNTYQKYGRCNVYKVSNLESYDFSVKKVKKLAKC